MGREGCLERLIAPRMCIGACGVAWRYAGYVVAIIACRGGIVVTVADVGFADECWWSVAVVVGGGRLCADC